MSILHLSIRIDRTEDYYYPPREGITPILRILIEKCKYQVKKLIMAEEKARKTQKIHCHIHVQLQVPPDSKTYKSFSQKFIREIQPKGTPTPGIPTYMLPPRQFSISSKPVKDILRFMRYPLKDQQDCTNVYQLGYTDEQLEIQRCLAFEERQKAISIWDLKEKKVKEENDTFEQLKAYLDIHAPIDPASLIDQNFNPKDKLDLERLGSKIIDFYRHKKKENYHLI